MKQFILALLLLCAPLSLAAPIDIPEPVTEIPLGVEIRGDMATMFLVCGKPHAVVLHTTTGIQIFQGVEMIKKLSEVDEGNGIPVVKTDLSDAWGEEDTCSAPAPVEEPDHRSVPIEEIIRSYGSIGPGIVNLYFMLRLFIIIHKGKRNFHPLPRGCLP